MKIMMAVSLGAAITWLASLGSAGPRLGSTAEHPLCDGIDVKFYSGPNEEKPVSIPGIEVWNSDPYRSAAVEYDSADNEQEGVVVLRRGETTVYVSSGAVLAFFIGRYGGELGASYGSVQLLEACAVKLPPPFSIKSRSVGRYYQTLGARR